MSVLAHRSFVFIHAIEGHHRSWSLSEFRASDYLAARWRDTTDYPIFLRSHNFVSGFPQKVVHSLLHKIDARSIVLKRYRLLR